jgi:dipeptidyl aminopeptidase/acylaminoacyl peptidase
MDGVVRPVLTGERQITMTSMAPGKRIAFVASDPHLPGDVFVADWDGSGERRLTRINDDLLAELELPAVERRSFSSPNGGSIDGWLMRPANARGPVPLLVQIHGGPHGFVGNVFSLGSFYGYVLAGRGWAMLSLNPSGSGSYGKEFMQSLMARWGEYDLPEQHAAIDALVAEGIADPDRLAVTGYSYGGYMTSWVVGHTDRFKAAVIGAPVTNLESFFGTSDIGMWFGQLRGPRDHADPHPARRGG